MKLKTNKLILINAVALYMIACHSNKKNVASPPLSKPVSVKTESGTSNTVSGPFMVSPVIPIPENEHLLAVRPKYSDVTLEQLNEGYVLYTVGACIHCHAAKDISRYGEIQWKDIIEDMAKRSEISDKQKDAVYKYVLAVKATQTKETK